MKNILLLSDLSLASLWPVHAVVKEQQAQPLNIHVVHMLNMPTSITDLLLLKSSKPHSAVNSEFTEALQLLKNKYTGQIASIGLRFLYGDNSRILNNYIDAHQIDCTYVTAAARAAKSLDDSVDFMPLLKRCSVPVRQTPLQKQVNLGPRSLSVLLDNETSFSTTAVHRSSFSYS